MNAIDSNKLEHDVVRKPLRTFRHHALGRRTMVTLRNFFAVAVVALTWSAGAAARHASLTRRCDEEVGATRRTLVADSGVS